MKEFFHNLKEIRQEKGLTLEDISKKCRLPLKYLQQIENGDMDKLPEGYDRIFFKRYLKEIGEDKEEVWKDFNLFFGPGPLEQPLPYSTDITLPKEKKKIGNDDSPAEQDTEQTPSIMQELSLRFNMDKIHRYFWIIFTVIVLGVVGYFAYQQFVFVKANQLQVKEITVSQFIEEMQRQDSLLTPQMSQNTMSRTGNPGDVKLELRAVQRTWVREIRDGEDTTDYIMPAGLIRKIEAREAVQLMLGRADGVEIWLNGNNLGFMGGPDEIVVRLLINRDGIAEKRLKKVTKQPAEEVDSTTIQTLQAGE
jgi:transcriptional regulator with XRE-family HTH domain